MARGGSRKRKRVGKGEGEGERGEVSTIAICCAHRRVPRLMRPPDERPRPALYLPLSTSTHISCYIRLSLAVALTLSVSIALAYAPGIALTLTIAVPTLMCTVCRRRARHARCASSSSASSHAGRAKSSSPASVCTSQPPLKLSYLPSVTRVPFRHSCDPAFPTTVARTPTLSPSPSLGVAHSRPLRTCPWHLWTCSPCRRDAAAP